MISPKPIYTHRVYVDFSGDLGDPRVKGSSKTVSIAWVVTAEEDIKHNEAVLLEIKKAIGCKKEDELKYRTVNRHPKKQEALAHVKDFKIKVVIVNVLKEHVHDNSLSGRAIAVIIHSFPLGRIMSYVAESTPQNELDNICIQLVFDQVTWSNFREELVADIVNDYKPEFKVPPADCIKFLDSKRTPLLQLADLMAGICRSYVESIDGSDLRRCQICWSKGHRLANRHCPRTPLGDKELMRITYPFLLKKGNEFHECGFITRPPEMNQRFWFIDCVNWSKAKG